MYRRAVLATTAAVAVASVAGCVADADPIDDTDSDDTGSDDGADGGSSVDAASDPDITNVEVSAADPGATGAAGEASIEFVTDGVHVEGTVLGETGCHGVELASTATTDEGALRVVVAAVDDAGSTEMCTQALTDIGYEVDAEFAEGLPESVTVVHDDADGREVVATDSSDTDE